ncbi:MAG: hypothetical protein WD993_01070 [Thermoleophilaceae bacterium]
MPDLAAILLRRSVGSLSSGRSHCSACRRTPLVGERLHETGGGRQICDLCVRDMPAGDRDFVAVTRIHASERTLAVGPRIAA